MKLVQLKVRDGDYVLTVDTESKFKITSRVYDGDRYKPMYIPKERFKFLIQRIKGAKAAFEGKKRSKKESKKQLQLL